jgi:hypothetical protein
VPDIVTVFGVDVEVTPLNRIEDKRDELRPFGIANLSPGNFLKIEGFWDGNKVIATRLERLEGEDKFKIRGPITDAVSPAFTLLGKIVQTSATFTTYSVGDQTITQFFNAIEDCLLTPPPEGCLAEAGWAADGPLSFADEVELED